MTASAERLRNYLTTLAIDPSSCQGFEDEALGACVGLVGWGWAGNPAGWSAARMAWMRAVTVAASNTSGGLKAGPANQSFFYSAIQHRQRAAFSPFGFSPPDWKKFDAGNYPWALPEPLFRKLDDEVRQGNGLAGARAVTWKSVTKTINDYKDEIGLSGPLGVLGKKLFKKFLLKFAPDLAEGAIAEWGAVVVSAGAFAAIAAGEIIIPIHNAQVKRAFEVDRIRRDYDKIAQNAIAAQ